jgi:tRNA(Ile)-lysidine synthase TilS/MesJ
MEERMTADLTYLTWKKDHHPILSQFNGKKLFALFSAGKDSSAALDLILRAAPEFGFEVEAHAGAFPVHRYTPAEKERISAFWLKRGAAITWYDLDITDAEIRATPNPCRPCQDVRRKLLKKILSAAVKDWRRLVIMVSFSLWDIVSYSIEHVLTDIYSPKTTVDEDTDSQRFRETAQRFYPLIQMDEGYSIFKPLIRYNNADILGVIAREAIPILSIPCEFREYRPKRILQRYYEKMGLRFDYRRVLDFAETSLRLPDLSAYTGMEKEEYLQKFF